MVMETEPRSLPVGFQVSSPVDETARSPAGIEVSMKLKVALGASGSTTTA